MKKSIDKSKYLFKKLDLTNIIKKINYTKKISYLWVIIVTYGYF